MIETHTPPEQGSPVLIDTHAHLNDPLFESDLEAVLNRAWEAGVYAIVTVGYDVHSSKRAVEIASSEDRVYASVGIHPNYSLNPDEAVWQQLEVLAGSSPKVVAIGEIGLDFYRDFAPKDAQYSAFERQIGIATRLGLPILVHSRAAAQESLDVISSVGPPPRGGVMHCYEGSPEEAATALGLGLHIGANGMATWDNRGDIREMLRTVPLDRLLLETDAPYLAPKPVGRRRNEPAFIVHVCECLADALSLSPDELAEATSINAKRLLRS